MGQGKNDNEVIKSRIVPKTATCGIKFTAAEESDIQGVVLYHSTWFVLSSDGIPYTRHAATESSHRLKHTHTHGPKVYYSELFN